MLFEKVRTPHKQFFYRRRGSDGNWVWNLTGVRRVVFGLPRLCRKNWVLVPEGEKDVESLWRVNLPATTNPEGAGPGKWTRAYSLQLKEAGIKRAYVIPDNDHVGFEHAREVVCSCRANGVAAFLLELPDLPPKGDISDFLSLGHTRRDLIRLIKQLRGKK